MILAQLDLVKNCQNRDQNTIIQRLGSISFLLYFLENNFFYFKSRNTFVSYLKHLLNQVLGLQFVATLLLLTCLR